MVCEPTLSGGNRARPRCTYSRMWLRLLLCATLFVFACEGVPASTSAPASSEGLASARVASADPSRLPTPAQERAIMQAFASAGIRGTFVIPSKFDWLFGSASPRSGIFSGTLDGMQVWADVHFIEATIEGITGCSSRSASGESVFTVSVKGRPQVLGGTSVTGALSGSAPMYFASGDRLFVMTPDARLRDALLPTLGLSVPSCT